MSSPPSHAMAECAFGDVVALDGEQALVRTSRAASCEGCENHDSCNAFVDIGDSRSMTVSALNPIGAQVGDRVQLDLAPGALVGMASLVYAFPALFAVIGAAVGAYWGPELVGLGADAAGVLSLAVFLLVALLVLWWIHPKLARRRSFRITITGVVSHGDVDAPEETGLGVG